ncbi:flagellar biosynthetic protein FliO [Anaerocolumna sp. AGMB13020]|uniref:flagellar biosynthetic protein FliO n=1 Tax=Anaerocolumna sp. AGMB13020 TaxID=3081750 RepID=UPI0029529A2B|nr:flagellar biosynthetic protein FliO [Anaerocolumna sp. AGMB13020]WOO36543.1 flagellar biosynthetic protein FliO [Anaerocolumna sp. AGMB13020]
MNIFLAKMSDLNNVFQLIGVTFLFLFVLVITYVTTKLIGGIKAGTLTESNFKVIDTYKVTQNKYMQIIKIGSKYFVIAVCKDTIQMITELKEEEIVLKEKNNKTNISFQEILKTIKKQNEKVENTGDTATDLSKSQESLETSDENHHQ